MSTAASLFRSTHIPPEDSPLRLEVPGGRYDFVKLKSVRWYRGTRRPIELRVGTTCYAFRTRWLDESEEVVVEFEEKRRDKTATRTISVPKEHFKYEQTVTPSIDSPIECLSNYAKGLQLQKLLRGKRLCTAQAKRDVWSEKKIEIVIHKVTLRNPFEVKLLYGEPNDEEGEIGKLLHIKLVDWDTVRRLDKEEALTIENEKLRRFTVSDEERARIEASYEIAQIWKKKCEKLTNMAHAVEKQFIKDLRDLSELANRTLSDKHVQHQLFELSKHTKLYDHVMQLRNLNWGDDEIETLIRSLAWIKEKINVEKA